MQRMMDNVYANGPHTVTGPNKGIVCGGGMASRGVVVTDTLCDIIRYVAGLNA